MKKLGVILASLAIVSLSLMPVTEAFAASGDTSLIQSARRGAVALITPDQMGRLAQTNPGLYAKLQESYRSQTPPHLTAGERALLRHLSATNFRHIKAGQATPASSTGTKVTVTTTVMDSILACTKNVVDAVTPFDSVLGPVAPFVGLIAFVGCGLYYVIPLIVSIFTGAASRLPGRS